MIIKKEKRKKKNVLLYLSLEATRVHIVGDPVYTPMLLECLVGPCFFSHAAAFTLWALLSVLPQQFPNNVQCVFCDQP